MVVSRKRCIPSDPHGAECNLDDFVEYYSGIDSQEELTLRWKWANGLISDLDYPKGKEIMTTIKRNKRLAYVLYKVNKL